MKKRTSSPPIPAPSIPKRIKIEVDESVSGRSRRSATAITTTTITSISPSATATTSASSSLSTKKQKSLSSSPPFPNYSRPASEECYSIYNLLSSVHGKPSRPTTLIDDTSPGAAAGCGATPETLDALCRTILSQNTTSSNSTAAKNAMDAHYGRSNYRAVLEGTDEALEGVIKCGGLAKIKSKVIRKILTRLDARNGGDATKELSLDYLREMSDVEAMNELVSFDGVGPKTASCVLLFNLNRESFAVDTHVFRITRALGWVPANATRDTTFAHLDIKIPGELKYPLHVLLVQHGRSCYHCSANGNTTCDSGDVILAKDCPIRGFSSSVANKSAKKGKGEVKPKVKKEESDCEAEEQKPEREDVK